MRPPLRPPPAVTTAFLGQARGEQGLEPWLPPPDARLTWTAGP